MENYSSDIEKLSKELSRALKSGIDIVAHEEIFSWVDSVLFNNNYIQQNHTVNLLWIFSKQRILKENKRVEGICNWLYKNLKQPLHNNEYEIVAAYIIVTIENLTKLLRELPSIRTCLSNTERDSIKQKISNIGIDDRILTFESSPQYGQLLKLKSIPIVNSFLDNYLDLLDLATDNKSDSKNVQSIMQYILTVEDIVKDSHGVLGLVDDLYAMQQLKIDFKANNISNIKWQFEINFPDFQYPILIDREGNNLISRVDDLIKASLIYSENSQNDPKIFFLDEVGPFSILVSILGCISKLSLDEKGYQVSNISKLKIGECYKISKGIESINLIFKSIYTDQRSGDKYYLMGGFNQYGESWSQSLDEEILEDCIIEHTNEPPNSQQAKFEKFKAMVSNNIHGMFPFGLANNLDIKFEKVFIVDLKKNLDLYLSTKIEGKSIEEWFGRRSINTKGEETISHGLLSNDPLITTAYNISSLFLYLYENDFKDNKFHSLNLVLSGSVDNDLEQITRLQNSFEESFKTLNIFSNDQSDYVEKIFKELQFQVFYESRALTSRFVYPPNNSLFENYLSKVGSYPHIDLIAINDPLVEEFLKISDFQLDRSKMKLRTLLFQMKSRFLRGYSQFSSTAKDKLSNTISEWLARLPNHTHAHKNISLLIKFLDENKEFILDFETYRFTQNFTNNSAETKVLVSDTEFNSLKRKGWEEGHITSTDLKKLEQIKHLIVPPSINRKQVQGIVNFPYAEKVTLIASQFEIDKYLKPLVDSRHNAQSSEVEQKDKQMQIERFEKIFIEVSEENSIIRSSQLSGSKKLYPSRLFILDQNLCLNLPKNGQQIITKDLIEMEPEEVHVKNIDSGNFLIIPDTQNASLQDSILDITVANIKEVREKAFLWKVLLEEALDSESITLDDIEESLKQASEKRHPATIKNWFKNPQLIAPDRPEVVFSIFAKLLDLEKNALDECLLFVRALYKHRNKVLDNLSIYLKNAYFDETENKLELKIGSKEFVAKVYETLTYQDSFASFEDLYKLRDIEEYFDE